MEMPVKYVVEMFLDRIAASKVYKGDAYTDEAPLQYFLAGKGGYVMHPKTQALLEQLLRMLADEGAVSYTHLLQVPSMESIMVF